MNAFLILFGVIMALIVVGGIWITRPTDSDADRSAGRSEPTTATQQIAAPLTR